MYGAAKDDGFADAEGDGRLRDPPDGRRDLQAQRPDPHQPDLPSAPFCASTASRCAVLVPGDYDLVLTVKDELAGQSVEVREPFEIVGT